ncbi:hypothetical protein CR513_48793, partial [Mucuna pruriens]
MNRINKAPIRSLVMLRLINPNLIKFKDICLVCEVTPKSVKLGILNITSSLLNEIRIEAIVQGKASSFVMGAVGVVRLKDQGHRRNLSVHPMKMYHDLKKMFWWPSMKKEVVEFVYACLVCQKAKIEHKKSSGLLQPLHIPKLKWDSIFMDFVLGLPKTQKNKNSI